ncbi:MerR family transcriptional regulator [Halobacillus litoralis]|uniref:MerR family transcriptional regulator n=1 Tax=Halobacillus litoralis TaxID=45668 RepID=UPI001CD449C8|nr:MerR family transcriptional regulator [Halobacillus litoralis]MCA0969436.1 MerR family transcriptional regulator [Halobacillus litoralis]
MYKVSEFAALTGFSKETLRYYAQVGLLEPAYTDPNNHYRYYDDGSYFLALLLEKLRSFDFTIQEMKSVMGDESFANLEELLLQKRQRMKRQIEELQARIQELDVFLESGKEDES